MADNPTTSPIPSSARTAADGEIDLFDYLCVIWRYRWSIVFLCVVAMALTLALSLRKPHLYQSTVTIVPPLDILQKESGGLGAMNNSLLRQVMNTAADSITSMYVEILDSREVADAVIDRFGLMEVYEDVEFRSDARKQLKKNTKVEMTDGGAVKIAIQDRDPNRAAAVAGAYVEELDKQNKRLSAGQATSKRVFLENRLKEVEGRLSKIDNILSREAKTQEMLYELLVQQYEMAKIEEAKSMPTIQVLDPPVAPELSMAQGTARKGVLAGITAFIFGVFLAFTREYVAQARRRRGESDARTQETETVAHGDSATTERRTQAIDAGIGLGANQG